MEVVGLAEGLAKMRRAVGSGATCFVWITMTL